MKKLTEFLKSTCVLFTFWMLFGLLRDKVDKSTIFDALVLSVFLNLLWMLCETFLLPGLIRKFKG